MAQNIYDQDDFFAGYSALRRSREGLAGAPEWPSLQAMLPPLRGRRVVDLGCGFGWFCRWAQQEGAASVLGLDLSEKMLARARAEGGGARYERADLETLVLPEGAFDLAYSSLAVHYVADFPRLARTVAASLAAGGRFVFSMEHPLYTAPTAPGWVEHEGRRVWPLDAYLAEGERRTDWLAQGVLKHHRSIATVVNALLAAGLRLARLVEWGPDAAQIAAQPEWAAERDRPPFLLVAADRPGPGSA
ncbi:MAG: class I SAM-dependent methyltransferase [Rhodospirillales bacterium]|nr:class I SAM-dependent methyltransferase [Rhodospirillales bacterium]